MFNRWPVEVVKRFLGPLGKRFPIIAPRTLLNLRKGVHRTSRLTPEGIADKAVDLICGPGSRVQTSRPRAEVERQIRAGIDSPGLLSAMVRGGMLGLEGDPRAVDFAREVDELSARVDEFLRGGDGPGLRDALFAAPVLEGPYWTMGGSDLRRDLAAARDLPAVHAVLRGLAFKVFLSTVALFDVRFAEQAFGRHRPAPVFLLLAPRLKPGLERIGGHSGEERYAPRGRRRGFRDAVDTPLCRFFDVVAALSMLRDAGGGGDWPPAAPALSDVYRVFGGGGRAAGPRALDKMRHGENKITVRDLDRLLQGRSLPEFGPLMFAAHAWEAVLVRKAGRSGKKPVSAMVPDGDYLPFWEMHKASSRGRDRAALDGAVPWPDYLLRPSLA